MISSVINPAERNALIGIKPTVGLTSRAGVVPESIHQDTVGTFARTVKDAVYALDAIYGPDTRDNYTAGQSGKTPNGGYAQFLTNKKALEGAVFGLPWASFWALNAPQQNAELTQLLDLISSAGATIINGTELPEYQTIVSPDGWNWDYGSTRGYPNESEYTVVKVDVNPSQSYLVTHIVTYHYSSSTTTSQPTSLSWKTRISAPSKTSSTTTSPTSAPKAACPTSFQRSIPAKTASSPL